MYTGAELGQYFCTNTVKNIQWGLNPFNPFWVCQYLNGYGVKEIVLNLTSRVPVNYYY